MTQNSYKIPIQGMTCTGCEEHVTEALEQAGAKDVSADFRRGEAIFELSDDQIEKASKIFRQPAINPERKKASPLKTV
ncbi:mercuric reductase [Staphylococcus aureus]|nr:mercuric reductase [Staphylococcus aureus]